VAILAVAVPALAARALVQERVVVVAPGASGAGEPDGVLGRVTSEALPVPVPEDMPGPGEQASEHDFTQVLVVEAAHEAVVAAVLRTAPVPVDVVVPDPAERPMPNALFLRARDGSGVVNVYTQTGGDGQTTPLAALSHPGAQTTLRRPDARTEIVVNDQGDGRPQQVIAYRNRLMVNMSTDRGVPGIERGAAVDAPTLRAWVDAGLADPAVEAASQLPLPDLASVPPVPPTQG